jgi:signal peptidase I
MKPTILHGSVLFIDKFFYKYYGFKKNDIVVATQPIDPSVSICKRIKYVEGETAYGVKIPKNHVWL